MQAVVLILLVEDDPLIRMPLEDALNEAGFTVVVATNGGQAIAELDAGAERFKALVTDIRLGKGPDGWEVARHARLLIPAMPVVYCSGDSAAVWAANGVPNSVMIEKPFVMAQLNTALSTLLNRTTV
jgi:DNA-binding response OmpR family regulator